MKKILSLLLAVCLLLGLAGCDSDDAYVPTGSALVMEGEDPDDLNANSGPPQELTLAYYPTKSLNPLQSTDYTNRVLFSLIYQNLFNVDKNYNTEPILCKEWQVSPDHKTYYFYLEDYVTFSDGTTMTIADVVASYKAATLSNFYGGRFTHVKEISQTEDNAMMIVLDTPYENLAQLMDIPILKANQVDADRPLGSGPYLLSSGLTGAHLRRVQNWWCKDLRIPVTAETIPLVAGKDASHIRDEFEFNDVGLVCADPCSDAYADYRCDYELWDCDNGIFLYLGFNTVYRDFFAEPEHRTAITYAIDRARLNQDYLNGFGRPTTIPADPMSPYYNATLASKYEYDPMRFVSFLGNLDPLEKPLELLVNSEDSVRLKIARDIAKTLTELGLPTKTLEYKTNTYREVYRAANFDMYLGQTKLSSTMDLSPFFGPTGNLHHNGTADAATYSLCLDSLANRGNYLNLYQRVQEEARVCSIMFYGYNIYATRGLIPNLSPARDNVFYYSLGKTMAGTQLPTDYENG